MTATERAIDAIQELIADGAYQPGQRLPVEADLAQQLGVSRGTLREAVRAMSFTGVVEVRQGDGTYVAEMDPDRLFAGLRLYAQTAKAEQLAAVLEARRILEPTLAGLAADRRSVDELSRMAEQVELMRSSESVEQIVVHDHEFHRLIAAAAHSPVLEHVLMSVAHTTLRLRVFHGRAREDYKEITLREHSRMLDAIEQGDAPTAAAHALVHVAGVERWLLSQLPDELQRADVKDRPSGQPSP